MRFIHAHGVKVVECSSEIFMEEWEADLKDSMLLPYFKIISIFEQRQLKMDKNLVYMLVPY